MATVATHTKLHTFSSAAPSLNVTVNNANSILYVWVHHYSGGGAAAPATIAYNSAALTLVSDENSVYSSIRTSLYKKVNPSTGTHSLDLTYTSGSDEVLIYAAVVEGADTTTPNRTVSSSQAQSTAVSQSGTSVSGDLVLSSFIGVLGSVTLTVASGGSQTNLEEDENVDSLVCGAVDSKAATTGSTTLSWTVGDNVFYSVMTMAIIDSGGGGGTPPDLTSVSPSAVYANSAKAIKILSAVFGGTTLDGASPSLTPPSGWSVGTPVITTTTITVDITVPAAESVGAKTFTFTTADGSDTFDMTVSNPASGGSIGGADMRGGFVN